MLRVAGVGDGEGISYPIKANIAPATGMEHMARKAIRLGHVLQVDSTMNSPAPVIFFPRVRQAFSNP
ncbi:MAG: hypothetical protein COU10_00500 [Candidatus Harrisonbacteria bacterium CG10_big_fil_rev_8_21_14_0_10_45_28]|uniref:Uncharacterized protein n=1 Tax=Candidatus Harrisonbacteria bacterium CG10_big_fil_rev_8_21_14_0_10_45_28 TaxID=1974586 RepID=A0A2H0UP52_9BACT|nr:MAG: hypothetical protein COU10_00500 [Candidatus Harrisonbacteria bacterium CG10_big_fil_rev_8_21_14_0_10_45_28]